MASNEHVQFPEKSSDRDYTSEFDYKNSDDLIHQRRMRKLLEDRMEQKRLKEACKDEWDEEDEFEWEKLDI